MGQQARVLPTCARSLVLDAHPRCGLLSVSHADILVLNNGGLLSVSRADILVISNADSFPLVVPKY